MGGIGSRINRDIQVQNGYNNMCGLFDGGEMSKRKRERLRLKMVVFDSHLFWMIFHQWKKQKNSFLFLFFGGKREDRSLLFWLWWYRIRNKRSYISQQWSSISSSSSGWSHNNIEQKYWNRNKFKNTRNKNKRQSPCTLFFVPNVSGRNRHWTKHNAQIKKENPDHHDK